LIAFLTNRAWRQLLPHLSLVTAIRERGEEVMVLCPEQIVVDVRDGQTRFRTTVGKPFAPHLVFHRLSPKEEAAIQLLEAGGVRAVNSVRAWRVCSNKVLQALVFAQTGIPHPPTLFALGGNYNLPVASPLPGEQLVLKPAHGRRGFGVRFLHGPVDVCRFLEASGSGVLSPYGPLLVQKFIDHPARPRHHVRCHVVGGKAVSAGRLFARPGRLVTNHAQGGQWQAYDRIPPAIADLAVAAAGTVGVDYAGVDLIADAEERWWVLECNNMPDLRKPMMLRLADYLVAQARQVREGCTPQGEPR